MNTYRWWRWGAIGLVVWGGLLRWWALGDASLWIDEGFSIWTAKQVWLGMQEGSVSYRGHALLQSFSFSLGGPSVWSARAPSALLSMLSIGLVGMIAHVWRRRWPVTLIAMAVMAWHSREIAWGRQARFYALIERLWLVHFLGLVAFVQGYSGIRGVWSRAWLLPWMIPWIVMMVTIHPFGWIAAAMRLIGVIWVLSSSQRRRVWLQSTRVRDWFGAIGGGGLVWWCVAMWQSGRGGSLHVSVPLITSSIISPLSRAMRRDYALLYLQHLGDQLGLRWVFARGAFWLAWRQRDFPTIVIGGGALVTIATMVLFQGYMFHTRYVLLVFPVVILLGASCGWTVLMWIRHRAGVRAFAVGGVILTILAWVTIPLQLTPVRQSMLDWTSPQHDFQALYAQIPDGRLVVTSFPILCDRYYSERGECAPPVPINLVADGRSLGSTHERYTGRPFMTNERWQAYLADPEIRSRLVVVLDSLSDRLTYLPGWIEQTRVQGRLQRRWTTGVHRIERYDFPLQYDVQKIQPY